MQAIRVRCVRTFVNPIEVGRQWTFASLKQAEETLGWFYVHNNCSVEPIPDKTALNPMLPWPFDRGEPETEQDVIDRMEESPL